MNGIEFVETLHNWCKGLQEHDKLMIVTGENEIRWLRLIKDGRRISNLRLENACGKLSRVFEVIEYLDKEDIRSIAYIDEDLYCSAVLENGKSRTVGNYVKPEIGMNGVFNAVKSYLKGMHVFADTVTIQDTSVKGEICRLEKKNGRGVVTEVLYSEYVARRFFSSGSGGAFREERELLAKNMVDMIKKINRYYTDIYFINWEVSKGLFQIFRECGEVVNGTVSEDYSEVTGIEKVRHSKRGISI